MKHAPIILILLWVCLPLLMSGCKSLANWTPEQEQGAQNVIRGTGAVLGPATGGISIGVSHVIAALLPTVVAVNRWWVGRKRAKALEHIDAKEGTPSAAEQVPAGPIRKAVRDVTG